MDGADLSNPKRDAGEFSEVPIHNVNGRQNNGRKRHEWPNRASTSEQSRPLRRLCPNLLPPLRLTPPNPTPRTKIQSRHLALTNRRRPPIRSLHHSLHQISRSSHRRHRHRRPQGRALQFEEIGDGRVRRRGSGGGEARAGVGLDNGEATRIWSGG